MTPVPVRTRPKGFRRLDASMTLLNEVMERPLDPSYAEAAARRDAQFAQGVLPRRNSARRIVVALAAIVIGFVTATAAHQLRVPQGAVSDARAILESQITERSAAVNHLSARADELSRELLDLQSAALEADEPGLLATISRDSMLNGTDPVTGPGLVITLSDGGGGLVAEPTDDARVRDIDLQTVVHSLWAAGAEAVSVDDQRITSKTAIRNAGPAVLVNLTQLSGPTYVVRAIGDPDAMQVALARGPLPAYLQTLGASYGIRSSVVAQSSLELPGVGAQPLQHARPVAEAQSVGTRTIGSGP